MEGWIWLHRQITEWEWYDDPNTFRVFMDLLLHASHNKYEWHGIEIERGQVVFGRKECARRLKIGEQSVRTSLERLKSTNEITIKVTNKFSLIQVTNWSKYQNTNQQSNQQTNQQLTSNQPATNHNQELKNDKNVKNEHPFSEETKKLSDFLYECIRRNNPNFSGSARKWDADMEKILRIDKRPYEQVAEVILFAQSDGFWRSNILSGGKLREKYDQLFMKASNKKSGVVFIS